MLLEAHSNSTVLPKSPWQNVINGTRTPNSDFSSDSDSRNYKILTHTSFFFLLHGVHSAPPYNSEPKTNE